MEVNNETYMIFDWLNFNCSDLKISTSNDLKINKVIYINLAFLKSYFSLLSLKKSMVYGHWILSYIFFSFYFF